LFITCPYSPMLARSFPFPFSLPSAVCLADD